ncbi:von Hippel-Lindau tumor suppressor homolog [Megalopta genalis]|uniref:von Hippel-Lindau tumor suppressor homolog n=1 Tax=Megalopta genalis TaxID=115081 RepID=UPI003FD5FEF1
MNNERPFERKLYPEDTPRVLSLDPAEGPLRKPPGMDHLTYMQWGHFLQNQREVRRGILPEKQSPFLRSLDNKVKSYVRFCNTTSHVVALFWIDYKGQAVRYGTLSRNNCLDIDTFVTHPWIFVDQQTGDRYSVNHKPVFYPEPHRLNGGGRTRVLITEPMYNLRDRALRVVAERMTNCHDAYKLEIPFELQNEVSYKISYMNQT